MQRDAEREFVAKTHLSGNAFYANLGERRVSLVVSNVALLHKMPINDRVLN